MLGPLTSGCSCSGTRASICEISCTQNFKINLPGQQKPPVFRCPGADCLPSACAPHPACRIPVLLPVPARMAHTCNSSTGGSRGRSGVQGQGEAKLGCENCFNKTNDILKNAKLPRLSTHSPSSVQKNTTSLSPFQSQCPQSQLC